MPAAKKQFDWNRITPEDKGNIGKLATMLRLTGHMQIKTYDGLVDRLRDNALTQADISNLIKKGNGILQVCETNVFQRKAEDEKQTFLAEIKSVTAAIRVLERIQA